MTLTELSVFMKEQELQERTEKEREEGWSHDTSPSEASTRSEPSTPCSQFNTES